QWRNLGYRRPARRDLVGRHRTAQTNRHKTSGPASARWRCWIPAVTAFDFAENADLGTSRCRFPSNRDTYSLNYEHWGHKLRGLLDSRNDSAAPRLFGQALDSSSMAL